ncbi:hypothetical protein M885DRAFT_341808 [Pelagophyceae sp. CCMP2097]|nr:hypothetical protein M885DRAFT_341808 [Pelagophyceae sp. CCMP2097]
MTSDGMTTDGMTSHAKWPRLTTDGVDLAASQGDHILVRCSPQNPRRKRPGMDGPETSPPEAGRARAPLRHRRGARDGDAVHLRPARARRRVAGQRGPLRRRAGEHAGVFGRAGERRSRFGNESNRLRLAARQRRTANRRRHGYGGHVARVHRTRGQKRPSAPRRRRRRRGRYADDGRGGRFAGGAARLRRPQGRTPRAPRRAVRTVANSLCIFFEGENRSQPEPSGLCGQTLSTNTFGRAKGRRGGRSRGGSSGLPEMHQVCQVGASWQDA